MRPVSGAERALGDEPAERRDDRRGAARRRRVVIAAARASLMRRARGGVPAAGDPRAAVQAADLRRRADRQPADPAVPGGRGRHDRATCSRACGCARGASRRRRAAGAGRARRASSPAGPRRAAAVAAVRGGRRCTRCRRSTPPTTRKARGEHRVLLRAVRAAVRAAARRALDARAAAALPRAWRSRWRSLFAGIGFVEYARKALFLNPKVVAANQYDNYFRVNSLFFDPNIYGRFLALVMIAVTTVVLWSARRRDMLIGAARARVAARGPRDELLAVEHRRAAARPRGARGVALGRAPDALRVAAALVALARRRSCCSRPTSLHFGLKGSGGSTSNATSGRTKLISGGLELFAERPLQGYGSGSFETEYKRHAGRTAENATSASHTIPVTVAAEQGIVGLALYVALLVSARSSCCSAAPAARRRGSPSRRASRRSCCTRGRTRTSSRTRSRGRCSRIGVALARQDGRWASAGARPSSF